MYLKTLFNKYRESRLVFFPKKHIKSIVGVKACIKNNVGEILLIQRSSTDRHSPLMWEFPGGSVEKGETLYETLKRETFEETNLNIKISDLSCYVFSDDISTNTPSVYSGFRRYVFIFPAEARIFNVKLSREHCAYLWCTWENSSKLPLTNCTKEYILRYKGLRNKNE